MKLRLPKGMLRETFGMALDSVRDHKFRSFLTVLGIVIGIMCAICIASLLTGMRQSIVAMIEEYGTNNIYAFHLSTGPRTGEDRSERLRRPLTVADAETIKAQAPAVEDVAHVAPKNLRSRKLDTVLLEIRTAAYLRANFRAGSAMIANPLVVVPVKSLIASISALKLLVVHVA